MVPVTLSPPGRVTLREAVSGPMELKIFNVWEEKKFTNSDLVCKEVVDNPFVLQFTVDFCKPEADF